MRYQFFLCVNFSVFIYHYEGLKRTKRLKIIHALPKFEDKIKYQCPRDHTIRKITLDSSETVPVIKN